MLLCAAIFHFVCVPGLVPVPPRVKLSVSCHYFQYSRIFVCPKGSNIRGCVAKWCGTNGSDFCVEKPKEGVRVQVCLGAVTHSPWPRPEGLKPQSEQPVERLENWESWKSSFSVYCSASFWYFWNVHLLLGWRDDVGSNLVELLEAVTWTWNIAINNAMTFCIFLD